MPDSALTVLTDFGTVVKNWLAAKASSGRVEQTSTLVGAYGGTRSEGTEKRCQEPGLIDVSRTVSDSCSRVRIGTHQTRRARGGIVCLHGLPLVPTEALPRFPAPGEPGGQMPGRY